jgi:hypothetical protein
MVKEIWDWIKGLLISLFLPIICIISGILFFLFGAIASVGGNQIIGSPLILVGIILFLSGLLLPVYFFVKSLFASVKDLSSKDATHRFSGLLGIIILAILIFSYRETIFKTQADAPNLLMIFFIASFSFIVILILLTKAIHLILSRVIRTITDLRNKK